MNTPDRLITTHLALYSRDEVRVVPPPIGDVMVRRWGQVDVVFYLFLYRAVGYDLRWRDRLIMPVSDLEAALHQADVHILYVGGVPAGYIELERHNDGSIEVGYFGLRADYHGRGLGKYLLSYGLQQAWEMNPTHITVHTCNLDGAYALHTYQAAGFKVVRVEDIPMPDRYKT